MANDTALVTPTADHIQADQTKHARLRVLWLIVFLACSTAVLLTGQAAAQDRAPGQTPSQIPTPTDIKPGSINLEDVPYPYPVSYLPLTMYGQDVRLAYMDVAPTGQSNGRTVVLLHGMNFFGEYWAGTIE